MDIELPFFAYLAIYFFSIASGSRFPFTITSSEFIFSE